MATSINLKVKNELCNIAIKSSKDGLSELSAIVRSCGVIGRSGGLLNLSVATENNEFIKHIIDLCDIVRINHPQIIGKVRLNLVFNDAKKLLVRTGIINNSEEFSYIDIPNDISIKTTNEKRAFARGYFLGSGFVSTGKNSHLEVSFSSQELRELYAELFKNVDISFKNGKRDGRYLLYIKSKDNISDFLAFIGASNASLDIMGEIAQLDVKKRTLAVNNCDMANINKSVSSAIIVADAIKKIDEKLGLDNLDDKLRTTAYIRLGFMEEPLSELALRLGVSKSCIKHRLDKLVKIANSV